MAVINVSPESFYKKSVKIGYEEIADEATRLEKMGADIIDVGGMSSAPYLDTWISEEEEEKRLREAIEAVKSSVKLPVSVDTFRLRPALTAIEAGADILNDVSGLKITPQLADLAREHNLSLILCAHGLKNIKGEREVIEAISGALSNSLRKALERGVDEERIILDPAIGFHRDTQVEWYEIDFAILRGIPELKRRLGRPLMIGVSRKSFLGAVTGRKKPEERLASTLAAETLAILMGADILRTHDVSETLDVIKVVEAFREKRYHFPDILREE